MSSGAILVLVRAYEVQINWSNDSNIGAFLGTVSAYAGFSGYNKYYTDYYAPTVYYPTPYHTPTTYYTSYYSTSYPTNYYSTILFIPFLFNIPFLFINLLLPAYTPTTYTTYVYPSYSYYTPAVGNYSGLSVYKNDAGWGFSISRGNVCGIYGYC